MKFNKWGTPIGEDYDQFVQAVDDELKKLIANNPDLTPVELRALGQCATCAIDNSFCEAFLMLQVKKKKHRDMLHVIAKPDKD